MRVETSEKRWVTLRLFWQVHRYVLGTIIAVGPVLELPAQPNLQELVVRMLKNLQKLKTIAFAIRSVDRSTQPTRTLRQSHSLFGRAIPRYSLG